MKLKLIAGTALLMLLGITFSAQSCKGDDDNPTCNIPNADLSYTKNIKAIIDQQCISCHIAGSGVQGVVGDFSTYELMKSRLENGKIHDRVVIKKDMPQGGGMTQAQRDSINCWIEAGFPK